MLGAFSETAVRKGLVQIDHNWSSLTRQDIYRQRVLGTRTGQSDFIKRDDQRKNTPFGLVVYIIFLGVCMQFTWARITVHIAYQVNHAIDSALKSVRYQFQPVEQRWADVDTEAELASWLINAFPVAISPAVQGFNSPLGEIRFSLRRITQTPSPFVRFKHVAPVVWQDQGGINGADASTQLDNKTTFGNYRVWSFNSEGGRAGLEWCDAEGFSCDGGQLLDQLETAGDKATVTKRCKYRCQQLTKDSKPCRCFTINSQSKCEFFYMPNEVLRDASKTSTSGCPIEPPPRDGLAATEAHWPKMQRFQFQDAKQGWMRTPGFVQTLRVNSQDLLSKLALYSGQAELTQAEAMRNVIRDWIDGGLLSMGMASLVIDFVTYNPNYEVYTWCQLSFTEEASGHINKDLQLSSLQITYDDINSKTYDIWSDLVGSDVIYLVLVAVYVIIELVEMGRRGSRYFHVAWNWLTLASLSLHLATLICRSVYLGNVDFTLALHDIKQGTYKPKPEDFQIQYTAYSNYINASSLNQLLMWFKLVHYFSDIFPRVGVLVNTIHRAMTPIFFLVVVIADVFLGFVVWANLMFGQSVDAFRDFGSSLTSCTELLFGQIDSFMALRDYYPEAGGIFFVIYMLLFYFILQNLSKAVVLASYDDATLLYESTMEDRSRHRAGFTGSGWVNNRLQDGLKAVRDRYERSFKKVSAAVPAPREERRAKVYEATPLSICAFATYLVLYVVMTYYMVEITTSNDLTQSVTAVIREGTFKKVDQLSGKTSYDGWDSVRTREDVMLFMTQVLPKTMFNSSEGTFEGAANPLQLYASALPSRTFTQLVINNWNIVLGQSPVRLTLRYSKLDKVGSDSIGNIISADARVANRNPGPTEISLTGTGFSPPLVEATSLEDIIDNRTRDVLSRRCAYKFAYAADSRDTRNGFSCMLSVNYTDTMATLKDLAVNNFVNNQTAILVADFVAYNGFAQAFVYVAVNFQFQPSGLVTKDVLTFVVRPDLYSKPYWWRIILEIVVVLFTHYYLGQSLRGVYKAVLEDRRDSGPQVGQEPERCHERMISVTRSILLHVLRDPFNFLDLASSILTLITMALWLGVVFSKLNQTFFFAESPTWDVQRCADSQWCGDDEVIYAFYVEGWKFRWFIRVHAINTLVIFLRMLKYLQVFPRVRVMFTTLRRAALDMFWFLVVMAILLMGYVCMGHQLFGSLAAGFSEMGSGFLSCFEMFLGTFNYAELREAEDVAYYLFSYSYVIILRYMMVNMFFAITDKHFTAEDRRREIGMKVMADRAPQQAILAREDTPQGSLLRRATTSVKLVLSRSRMSLGETFEGMSVEELADKRMAGVAGLSPRSRTSGKTTAGRSDASDTGEEDDDFQEGRPLEGKVTKAKNFKFMPTEMQDWAVSTARDVWTAILDYRNQRRQAQSKKAEVEATLLSAEDDIRQRRDAKAKEADTKWTQLREHPTGALSKLREIHRDQESLAWYNMKREAELGKLTRQRDRLRDHSTSMAGLARQVVQEAGAPGGPPQGTLDGSGVG